MEAKYTGSLLQSGRLYLPQLATVAAYLTHRGFLTWLHAVTSEKFTNTQSAGKQSRAWSHEQKFGCNQVVPRIQACIAAAVHHMHTALRCRTVFIKSLQPCPSDPDMLQQLTSFWLGQYGLLLPTDFLFMVGVADHPENEKAAQEVCA